jgi:hypothetical protein
VNLICNPGRWLELEGRVTLVPMLDGALEARIDGEKLAEKLQLFIADLENPHYLGRVRITVEPAR